MPLRISPDQRNLSSPGDVFSPGRWMPASWLSNRSLWSSVILRCFDLARSTGLAFAVASRGLAGVFPVEIASPGDVLAALERCRDFCALLKLSNAAVSRALVLRPVLARNARS